MVSIYDLVTAENIAGYYSAAQEGVDLTIGERFFPARKQLGLALKHIKAAGGKNVALKPSAFNVEATLRDRISVDLDSKKMPFFKEAMNIDEEDRQELNIMLSTNNQQYIDAVATNIYDDQATLVRAAKTQLEIMRMQVLATGKVLIDDNGVDKEFDYGVSDNNKGEAEIAWSEASADPLDDIDNAILKLKQRGVVPGAIVMNSNTFAQIKNNENTSKAINGTSGKRVTNRRLKEFLQDEYGLVVVEQSGVYENSKGETHPLYPDGHVTLAPNTGQGIGRTVFGTTPEESDLMNAGSLANVRIVEEGIAVTTSKEVDPVNVLTKVSMIALPSFEGANQVYQLHTAPTA